MQQEIRFCTSQDGARIAWARYGRGPTLVKAANWLTHLEHDWESPVWRWWLEALGRTHSVVRYDERGCGLSDRDAELDLERHVADLEAVVDAAGHERFTLLACSQGAPISIVYATRHPERVERLVVHGGYARGRRARGDEEAVHAALEAAIRAGWDSPNPAFRRMFTMRYLPAGSPEQHAWYDDLQRTTTSAETAARLYASWGSVDVSDLATRVRAPTLITHSRGDGAVPFKEGLRLAGLIPGARFIPLESVNHLLLPDEPAYCTFLAEFRAFTGTEVAPAGMAPVEPLSARELEVLSLVAEGHSNEAIADRLVLSVRTVERHLSNVYVKLRVSGKAARAAAAARFSQLA